MTEITECFNPKCDMGYVTRHVQRCPQCGSENVEHGKRPDSAADVGILRDEYNQRNAGKPGFVPSIEYVVDPNDPTGMKTIPKKHTIN